MFEFLEQKPVVEVQEAEYKRLLGFPAHYHLEGRPRELAEKTRRWFAEHGRPWFYARQVGGIERAGFSSQQLHDTFKSAGAHGAIVAVFSAGPECEEEAARLWQDGKPDEYFFLESYGSAVVEQLVALASGQLCAWADGQGMAALPHYSPGYSGWDVSDQGKLWSLFRQGKNSFPSGIDVMESGMLRPKKSLLAVFGLTRFIDRMQTSRDLVPCVRCLLDGCRFRRAPYQHSLPQVEDVRRLQAAPGAANGLRFDAKYTVNQKALRKWSEERLELRERPDGFIEAFFRYEGTTCSNMGRTLDFRYEILLGPEREGFRILEAICEPAPGDTGHAFQCEYLRNAAGLQRSLQVEKPLRGCPLADVFDLDRAYNPSGCFCDAERRLHKWGLVYEVIHYALVQRSNKTASN